ncbi:hypothetical protein A9Z63_12100 [Moraxella lacunata]|uniref:Uncharacterized protein n=1 Tax=Moraxella lacunata TaxID=477 RepID=A0A1B8PVX0_MORLA|nr:hypothetical protein A9Z63_12100 [Moraxella lacunata]OBX59733.1 hypothetical protein A9309_10990 [Moraxella lacunata]
MECIGSKIGQIAQKLITIRHLNVSKYYAIKYTIFAKLPNDFCLKGQNFCSDYVVCGVFGKCLIND